MPAKQQHHSPEESPPKQDPTERRRLQNRLSQRNHRRKIRDRIAKLQERVIASELRAAASLHGWHSTPCIPYEVKPSPSSSTSSSVSLSPPSGSPPNELQFPQPSYNAGLNTVPQLPMLSTGSGYDDAGSVGLSMSGSGASSPSTLVPPDVAAGAGASALLPSQSQGFGLDTMAICEQWGFQGSYMRHFVQFLEWFDDSERLFIAMEFMEYGDLQKYISARSAPFPEPEAALIIAQVARAASIYAPEGFRASRYQALISSPGPDWHAKVADFGITKRMDNTGLITHGIASPGYMAPEPFGNTSNQYTAAVDMWALGDCGILLTNMSFSLSYY
ncbi:transcription factor xanC [Aspergillus undulatus]|uniref:transcription factor xanC n=1 Tax=Aspergillus undulatus TaxID=1810928 RepID=UPI003CCDAE03